MAIHYTEALDRTFHALGDASRRRMLAVLHERGACTAGELGELFESAQPTVSKHLRVLEEAELVHRRIDGRRHVFSLAPARIQQAQTWLARHVAFWEGSLDQLEDVVEELQRVRGKKRED
jgi:DNA-binding transcriptional ArsR family regulator